MLRSACILGFTLVALFTRSLGLSNGLATTPLMGWNSWNSFHDEVNETLIKETTDLLVSTGLAGVGYNYVVIDGAPLLCQQAAALPHNSDQLGTAWKCRLCSNQCSCATKHTLHKQPNLIRDRVGTQMGGQSANGRFQGLLDIMRRAFPLA